MASPLRGMGAVSGAHAVLEQPRRALDDASFGAVGEQSVTDAMLPPAARGVAAGFSDA
jgi:hypothetical protein